MIIPSLWAINSQNERSYICFIPGVPTVCCRTISRYRYKKLWPEPLSGFVRPKILNLLKITKEHTYLIKMKENYSTNMIGPTITVDLLDKTLFLSFSCLSLSFQTACTIEINSDNH